MVNVHSSGEWSSWHRSLWSHFGSLGTRRGCHSTLSFSYILSRFYSFFNLVRRIGGREDGATHTLAPGKRGWPHPPPFLCGLSGNDRLQGSKSMAQSIEPGGLHTLPGLRAGRLKGVPAVRFGLYLSGHGTP